MIGPIGTTPGARPSREVVSRLKAVVREELRLGADAPVVVHEAACTEPGCAPVETIVAVLDGTERTFRIDRPLADLTPADLRTLIREGHDHDHDC
jgi:hypothetical protein